MARVVDILRTPFSFLFVRSRKEDMVAEYVIREHHQGRALAEILKDAYVTNRLSSARSSACSTATDVLHAVGSDMVAAHREAQAERRRGASASIRARYRRRAPGPARARARPRRGPTPRSRST